MTPRDNISNGNVSSGNEQQKEKSYENHEPKKVFSVFGIYQGLVLTKKFKADELFWNVAGLSSTKTTDDLH